jgi:hypothetical protein
MNYARILFCLFLLFISGTSSSWAQQALFSQPGIQPNISVGADGNIEMVFGQGNAIYYSFSKDQGKTFAPPTLVDSLQGLHLGVSRGPRVASSPAAVVITAIDKPGNLYAYTLERKIGEWQGPRRVNDVPEIAKEGFNALASDGKGKFFVTWLDLRDDQNNKIFGATSLDGGRTWSKNKLVYRSPDSTVCECCQPSAIMQGDKVHVMFRNWLNGSRDMYVATSLDGGETFQSPVKQGEGTWKINACPMDGGDLSAIGNGLTTVWRREKNLFISKPGQAEQPIGQGRNASVATSGRNTFIVWQDQNQIWLRQPGDNGPKSLGAGRFPRLAALRGTGVFCVWEDGGTIKGMVLDSMGR